MNDTSHMVTQGEVLQKQHQSKSHRKGLSSLCFYCSSDFFFLGCRFFTKPVEKLTEQEELKTNTQ